MRFPALAAAILFAVPAAAQEVTLRLHHYLPPTANLPALVFEVWAANVEAASEGRIAVDLYPSMQLGGTPADLIDQARDGVADVVFTVVGYTPGRFPRTEVFELPFLVADARAASYAYWTLFQEEMTDDFPGLKVLATWVHGPGVIHADGPVETPADLEGLRIRGGSRPVTEMLEAAGAEPVGLPVPAVPEALSRGVIDGTTIPWEVTTALRIPDLVEHHTEFEGAFLYTLSFVAAMDRDVYDALPNDLRAVIDAQSGAAFSVFAGGTQADADAPARALAVDAGNAIVTVSGDGLAAWAALAEPVRARWVADMDRRGIDGQALIDRAEALMDAYDPTLDTYGPIADR